MRVFDIHADDTDYEGVVVLGEVGCELGIDITGQCQVSNLVEFVASHSLHDDIPYLP